MNAMSLLENQTGQASTGTDWGSIVNAGTGLVGSIIGLMSDPAAEQYKYQKLLMGIQDQYNQAAEARQFNRQKEMYEYTGYASKVRQMTAAGLNPALLYGGGGSGAGGTVGNTPALGVSGAAAPNMAAIQANKLQAIGMGLQLAKLRSEISVNESVAQVNKAQAEQTIPATVEKTKQETANLQESIQLIAQQTKSEAVRREGMELSNTWSKVENAVKTASQENEINRIAYLTKEAQWSAQKMINDARQSGANADVIEQSVDSLVKQNNLKVEQTVSEIILNNSKNKLTKEQANATAQSVLQEYYKLIQGAESIKVDIMGLQTQIYNTLQNNNAAMDRTVVSAISNILQSTLKTGGSR